MWLLGYPTASRNDVAARSDDLPGLILSHRDLAKLMATIPPAIETLVRDGDVRVRRAAPPKPPSTYTYIVSRGHQ
jgi:hypothetical protein